MIDAFIERFAPPTPPRSARNRRQWLAQWLARSTVVSLSTRLRGNSDGSRRTNGSSTPVGGGVAADAASEHGAPTIEHSCRRAHRFGPACQHFRVA